MVLDNSFSYILGYIVAWLIFISAVVFSLKFLKNQGSSSWRQTLIANLIFTIIGVIFIALLMEGYYGFFYDETDSYGLLMTYERWFKRHYRLNNLQFRDNKDYFMKKEKGRRRIVFMGDSFTAGHGIKKLQDRFPALIEEMLKKEGWTEYEVYTIAKNGWDTNKYLMNLSRLAREGFDADIVILCYTMNDIGWASPESESILKSMNDMRPKNWLLQHSYFLNFMYWRINILYTPEGKNYYGWLAGAYTDKVWDTEQLMLRELMEGCKNKGWTVKAAILPLIGDLSTGFKMKAAHTNVARLFSDYGINHIDLADKLKAYPSNKTTVNKYDSHPNEFAHKVIAEEIWNKLLNPRNKQ